jgi:hypothetical protein
LLEVLEALVAKPWMTARVTAAVLMRKVHAEQPTLLLDESDAAFSQDEQYAEALRGMLNAGFHRSGKASVCVGVGANLTFKDFSVFGPKAISGIGHLPSTVESRSIPITMKRKTKGETIHKWRRRDAWQRADPIRARLETVMAPQLDALRDGRPWMPDDLSDRAEDVMEPLFAIADLAGGEWPEPARAAAVALMGQAARIAQEADQHLPLELLQDVGAILTADDTDPDFIATKTLLDGLKALDDRPWATFGKTEKGLTAHGLSRLLKRFDIRPAGQVRIAGEPKAAYRRLAFMDALLRYTGSDSLHAYNANENGPELPKIASLQTGSVTKQKTAIHPDKHCLCTDVTNENPEYVHLTGLA